ncbi:MAG: AsmA family protein [Gammaproteobacteria bacterium]|nr:AsmA family protein [Gammaproteobacteria bacterium]
MLRCAVLPWAALALLPVVAGAAEPGGRFEIDLTAATVVVPAPATGGHHAATTDLELHATLLARTDRIELTRLQARIGASELAGQASIALDAGAVRAVDATLESTTLDFDAPWTAAGTQADARLLSDTPLLWHLLRGAPLRIDWRAARVKAAGMLFENVHAELTQVDDRVHIALVRAILAAGRVSGQIRAELRENPPRVLVELHGRGILPDRLPRLADRSLVRGAETDFDIELRGQGQSIAAIAATSTGELRVEMGAGGVTDAPADTRLVGLLLGLIRSLNPLAAATAQTELECAVLHLRVVDGIAASPTGVGLRTADYDLLGGGSIDLRSERIAFEARPQARTGAGLAGTALGGVVRVDGSLADPRIHTGAEIGPGTAAHVGTAVARGSLSLLTGGLIDGLLADGDPCTLARSGGGAAPP